jgi:hypothetical protein
LFIRSAVVFGDGSQNVAAAVERELGAWGEGIVGGGFDYE